MLVRKLESKSRRLQTLLKEISQAKEVNKSGLLKTCKVRLSKSGKALEVELDNLPCTVFTLHLYAPLARIKKILDKKMLEADISLLVGDQRNLSGENKALRG